MEIFNKYPPKENKKTGRRPKFKLEFMNMVAEKVVIDGMTFRSPPCSLDTQVEFRFYHSYLKYSKITASL